MIEKYLKGKINYEDPKRKALEEEIMNKNFMVNTKKKKATDDNKDSKTPKKTTKGTENKQSMALTQYLSATPATTETANTPKQ